MEPHLYAQMPKLSCKSMTTPWNARWNPFLSKRGTTQLPEFPRPWLGEEVSSSAALGMPGLIPPNRGKYWSCV